MGVSDTTEEHLSAFVLYVPRRMPWPGSALPSRSYLQSQISYGKDRMPSPQLPKEDVSLAS